jgi:hypothetical protein
MHRSKRNLYSITSSARCWRDGGTSRSSAFAVLRLMTSSYVVITVQCLGHFLEGEIAPIMSTENNAGHLSVDLYTIFGCLVQTFSRWGIQYGVSPMSSLEQRVAAVTNRTANLIAQLIELNRLRDRLRKAQLAWRSRRIERRRKPRR